MRRTLVVGATVAVAIMAVGLRWAAETSLLVELQFEMTVNVPRKEIVDFFIKQPDLQFLHSPALFPSPWNLVSTVQVSESVIQHTLTLSETMPLLNTIAYTLITTCDRGNNVVWMNLTGLACAARGAITLFVHRKFSFSSQDLGDLPSQVIVDFKVNGPRFLWVFRKTAREVAEIEHRVLITNLKKTLENDSHQLFHS